MRGWEVVPAGPRGVVALLLGEVRADDLDHARQVALLLPRAALVLDLSGAGDPAASAAEALRSPSAGVRGMQLRRCALSRAGAAALGSLLRQDRQLWELRLVDCPDAGDTGGAAIAAALASNRELCVLEMSRCRLGEEAASALAAAVQVNDNLRELVLSCNPALGGPCGVEMARAVTRSRSLLVLRLRDCALRPEFCAALAQGLRSGGAVLQELDVARNRSVGDLGGAALATALQENASLRKLDASECDLRHSAAEALALALRSNCKLEELRCDGNFHLGDAGGRALAAALGANRGLGLVTLRLCSFGPAVLQALSGAAARPSLRVLLD